MPQLPHRRLRAPAADGFALIDPPLSQAAALIERNRTIGKAFDESAGFPTFFRDIARRELVQRATRPTASKPDSRLPIILSGHQPELFHPGVWLKSFALDAAAGAVGGTAVNLVIDNDLIRSAGIGVPTGSIQSPRVEPVLFDAAGATVPWEQRPIIDRQTFAGFAHKVRESFAPFLRGRSYRPGLLVEQLWPHINTLLEFRIAEARRRVDEHGLGNDKLEYLIRLLNLGHTLSEGRRRLEEELGLRTQERALSAVCDSKQFLVFATRLFERHVELHGIYNAALAEYRTVNQIRGDGRPVPDLHRNGDWYEVPFWILNDSEPGRQRAYVRNSGSNWELSDGRRSLVPPWSTNTGELQGWLHFLAPQAGIRLRPRALITTMYARLVLSDLFIHGIGGAKYDEVTDLIIRRFFGVEPPAYITATATFRLPIERPQVTLQDVREAAQRIREARYRPESFVRDPLVAGEPAISAPLAALAAEKRAYLDRHDLRRCPPYVFAQLDRLNRAMHELLAPAERELRARHADLVTQAQQSQLLGSREFSFVLFPSEILPARLLDLCKVSP